MATSQGVSASPCWKLTEAVRVVRGGGVIAYPTEAVYGLGCAPLDEEAVSRLLSLKKRPVGKGLILIACCYEQLRAFVVEPEAARLRAVRETWPGPVTWVFAAHTRVPRWLRGDHSTIAVRVTAHPLAATLCQLLDGPLVSTSANITGCPAARTALAVRRVFGKRLDYILAGATAGRRTPSEIRDVALGSVIRA